MEDAFHLFHLTEKTREVGIGGEVACDAGCGAFAICFVRQILVEAFEEVLHPPKPFAGNCMAQGGDDLLTLRITPQKPITRASDHLADSMAAAGPNRDVPREGDVAEVGVYEVRIGQDQVFDRISGIGRYMRPDHVRDAAAAVGLNSQLQKHLLSALSAGVPVGLTLWLPNVVEQRRELNEPFIGPQSPGHREAQVAHAQGVLVGIARPVKSLPFRRPA